MPQMHSRKWRQISAVVRPNFCWTVTCCRAEHLAKFFGRTLVIIKLRSTSFVHKQTSITRRVFSWPWNVMKYIGSCSKRSAYSSNRSRFFTRFILAINHSIFNQSINHSINHSFNHSINQSINHWIIQLFNLSTDSTNQEDSCSTQTFIYSVVILRTNQQQKYKITQSNISTWQS